MLVAVLPVLIGLFLLAMERFEAPERHRGNEADIHRQGSRRPIEGHGTWTYR